MLQLSNSASKLWGRGDREREKSRNYIFHHADNNHFVVCIMKKKNEIIGSHNDECRQHSDFSLMCILLPSSISHRDIVCAAFVPYTQASVCELFVRSVHIKQSWIRGEEGRVRQRGGMRIFWSLKLHTKAAPPYTLLSLNLLFRHHMTWTGNERIGKEQLIFSLSKLPISLS